jgi:hypothetical protein
MIENRSNPQIFLHNSYTGKNQRVLSRYFKPLGKSKDFGAVKGTAKYP